MQSSPMPEIVPPPPVTGYGDTIIASNPFDDTPAPQQRGPPPQGPPPGMGHGPVPGPRGFPPGHGMGPPPHGPPCPPGMMRMGCPPGMGGPPGGPPPQGPPMMGPGGPMQQWNGPSKPPIPPIQTGKIYPEGQPMIFNPQNPNAPAIFPCGSCHKEVHDNDQAIPCESGCHFWYHRVCTGLTEAAFYYLNQEVYAEWVCDGCLSTKNIPLVKFKP